MSWILRVLCHYLIGVMSCKGQAQWVIYVETGGVIVPLFSDITQALMPWAWGQQMRESCLSSSFFSPLPAESSVHAAECSSSGNCCLGGITRAAVLDKILRAWIANMPGVFQGSETPCLSMKWGATGHHIWFKWRSAQRRSLWCGIYHDCIPIRKLL